MTCMCVPISCITSAILLETSPETPVSISSKRMVGSFAYLDKINLTPNMILESSPPEATFFKTSCGIPLLAENKKFKSSLPLFAKSSVGCSEIWKVAFSMPNLARMSCSCLLSFGIAAILLLCNWSQRLFKAFVLLTMAACFSSKMAVAFSTLPTLSSKSN